MTTLLKALGILIATLIVFGLIGQQTETKRLHAQSIEPTGPMINPIKPKPFVQPPVVSQTAVAPRMEPALIGAPIDPGNCDGSNRQNMVAMAKPIIAFVNREVEFLNITSNGMALICTQLSPSSTISVAQCLKFKSEIDGQHDNLIRLSTSLDGMTSRIDRP